MVEIVSSLPSSGGPYFWAIHLAGRKDMCWAQAMLHTCHPARKGRHLDLYQRMAECSELG